MIKSNITGKSYNPDNNSSMYISNVQQAYRFLRNGGSELLMDILFQNTKNNCLVFVFKKCPELKELMTKWNNHELD